MVDNQDEYVDESCGENASLEGEFDEQYRQRLYRITADPALTSETKLRRLLELGCEYLGVENGHVTEIDQAENRHEVVAAAGSDVVESGAVTSLDETFCRKTVTRDEILSIHNAPADGWSDDPAHELWDVSCYIGSKLLVQGTVTGTVCFVNRTPREDSFTAGERTFVDFVSRSVAHVLEREVHEQALQRERERLQLFIEEVSDYAMFLLDPAGHVVTWNEGARLLTHYREDEILGEHVSVFYPEEARTRGLPSRLLEEAIQMGRVEDNGWRVRKDGSTFWARTSTTAILDDEGELLGFGKVTHDLTAQREAQRELEAERAFTERALNALEDIFFVVTPDGAVERVNERAVAVTGYTEAEILSMDLMDVFVPEKRGMLTEKLETVVETGEATVEATVLTNAGKRTEYEFRMRALTDDDGTVTAVVGIGRDITERKLYEERFEVAQRILRHNLRNDLNAIQAWSDVLNEAADSDQQEVINRIDTVVDRLITLSEKTRTMAAVNDASPERKPADLVDLLPRVIDDFRVTYPAARIEYELPSIDQLRLSAGEQFETALRNAIENAVEHNDAVEPWVRVVVEHGAGELRVHVHDNGPGIPEDNRRVLEEGTETQLMHGSGIGLWLIHWCVTTSGGEVTFEEREPRGSTVTLKVARLARDF